MERGRAGMGIHSAVDLHIHNAVKSTGYQTLPKWYFKILGGLHKLEFYVDILGLCEHILALAQDLAAFAPASLTILTIYSR